MLNQIGLKAIMSRPVTQHMMHMQELFPRRCPRLWLNQLTLKFPVLVIDVVNSLYLNDHVARDDTC
jgi:hypothetical protein